MRKYYHRFRISKIFIFTIGILILPLHSYPADDEAIEKTGDVLQIALPVAAGATTLILQDWEGSVQFAKAFGASWLTTYGLKYAIGKVRPASDHPTVISILAVVYYGSLILTGRPGSLIIFSIRTLKPTI